MNKFRTYCILHLLNQSRDQPIDLPKLHQLLQVKFPWIQLRKNNWYRIIVQLEKQKLIETNSLPGIPPKKQINITPSGISFVKSFGLTLSNLIDPPAIEKSNRPSPLKNSKMTLDENEQGDLIQSISWMLPEITGKELEEISMDESKKLESFARRLLNKICKDIGISFWEQINIFGTAS